MIELTVKQEKFAQEFVACGNASEAYRRAYDTSKMKATTVETTACATMKVPKIAARIAELKGAIVERAEIDGAAIVKQLVEIAFADPNELVTHRRVNCRYCNGIDHKYQWKHLGEFHYDHERWEEQKEDWEMNPKNAGKRFKPAEPSEEGGYGFRKTNEPHPACPVCEGEGVDEIFIADTSKVSPAAKRLYAGAKHTKNGIEIAMHSQDNARRLLGEHFGIFKSVIEANIRSQNLNANATFDPKDPAEASKMYQFIMAGGKT